MFGLKLSRNVILILVSTVAAVISLFLALILSGSLEFAFSIAGAVVSIVFLPYGILVYLEHRKITAVEDRFPEFLRDLAQAVASGSTIPKAIVSASTIDYGALSPEVQKMANQISWGIPFPRVIKQFVDRVRTSRFITRAMVIVMEAYKSGGEAAKVIESVSQSANLIKAADKERQTKLYQQMAINYAIFFIFIGIVVMLSKVMEPILSLGGMQTPFFGVGTVSQEYYTTLFRNMLIIQGLFTGLIVGQVGEGSIKAGIKHSAIMVLSALLVTFLLL